MKPVTLKFLRFHCLDRHHCAVQYHQLVDGIIRRFEEAIPDIRIESKIMRNWYQLMYTLKKKLPSAEGPDIFHTCGGGELQELVEKELAYDLSKDLDKGWRAQFAPASLSPLSFGGREYAVPLEQGVVFVWYNREIFNRLGLSVPKTFDDLLGLCRALRSAGIIPFTVGNRERWPGAFFFSHLFHRIGGESVFVSDFRNANNYEAVRESFIGAAQKILKLSEAGAFHEDCDVANYQEQRRKFVAEEAAMQLNGNRLLNYLKVEGPRVLDRLAVFPFPLVWGGQGGHTTIFGGSLATYAISQQSPRKAEAVRFLRSLTDRNAAMDVIHNMGDIPAMTHVPYEAYPSRVHGDMAKSLGAAEQVQVHYFKYLSPHAAGVYLNVVAGLFRGELSPEEAFKTVEEALTHGPQRPSGHPREEIL